VAVGGRPAGPWPDLSLALTAENTQKKQAKKKQRRKTTTTADATKGEADIFKKS